MGIQERYRPEKKRTPLSLTLRLILSALIISASIRLFLFETVTIDGPEMLPGVSRGEGILVNRFATGIRVPLFNSFNLFSFYTPETGDLVLIKHPWQGWSGIAEFFDICTASIFGLTGDAKMRLVRVMARGGQHIRIDASGTVHVDGKVIQKKRIKGNLTLRNRADKNGNVTRSVILNRMVLDQSIVQGDPLPDLTLSLYAEGSWKTAESEDGSGALPARIFPVPVTNDALAVTWATRWLALTVLREENAKIAVLKAGQKGQSPAVLRDDTGNLWYQLEKEDPKKLVDVQSGEAWLIVPEDMLFVLNDLRDAMYDSRIWGPVFEDSITGIPMLRIWPFGRLDSLD